MFVLIEEESLPGGEFEIRRVTCRCSHACLSRAWAEGTAAELSAAGWTWQRVIGLGNDEQEAQRILGEGDLWKCSRRAGAVCPYCNERGRIIDAHARIHLMTKVPAKHSQPVRFSL